MSATGEEVQELTPGQRWKQELDIAKEWLKPWHESGRSILKRLKDERPKDSEVRRANYFTAEYLTKRAILYGKTPMATVSRRWKDPDDDIARVAAEELDRLLNDDIASGADGYGRALGYALENRLSVGMGQCRVRYELETEEHEADTEPITQDNAGPMDGNRDPIDARLAGKHALHQGLGPAVDDGALEVPASSSERVTYECVKVDYVYWGDFLWAPSRYWEVVRWVAFKGEMGRKALTRRFGKKGATLPLDANTPKGERKDGEPEPPWARAVVWEIWDKEEKEVVWVTEAGVVLDTRKDPYRLKDFFPCPRPLFSLITTDEQIPRPDFVLAQDFYDDLDNLSTRMHLLRTALRVVGLYEQTNTELAELLNNPSENRMVPVKNWAQLSEKGGVEAAVQFFPIQQIAATLISLSQEYDALEARLDRVTGFSDILRGQGASTAVTATEQRIKASFGSARLQALQDDFARFATELQALKAEMIGKHIAAEEIVRASNMLRTANAKLAMPAALFLKQEGEAFRVKVQPETLALADFAEVKEERLEVVAAVGQYIAAATPLLQVAPGAGPALLEILKWLVASLRGASDIEGILDAAIAKTQQAAGQPQGQPQQGPDPKVQAQMLKGQQDMEKVEAELKADLVRTQAEVQADNQRENNQRIQNVQETAEKARIAAAARAAGGGLT